jgi:hypothetical protein
MGKLLGCRSSSVAVIAAGRIFRNGWMSCWRRGSAGNVLSS